jgi:hypothetical protein
MMRKSLSAGSVLLACGLLAAAGCSSSSSKPSWASALGSNVQVSGPAQTSAGNGSPGAVVTGLLSAIASKHYADECQYAVPSQQSSCRSSLASQTAGNAPTVQNGAVGYVAINGSQALVGTTGKFCSPSQTPACFTNNDPAAIFAGNTKSFASLWTTENNSSGSSYALIACTEIGGKWYLYTPSS